jgi:hypothetical protein
MLLVGKPEGKRPQGRPRCRWVNIKMDLVEIVCDGMEGIDLAQDRPVEDSCEHDTELSGSIK